MFTRQCIRRTAPVTVAKSWRWSLASLLITTKQPSADSTVASAARNAATIGDLPTERTSAFRLAPGTSAKRRLATSCCGLRKATRAPGWRRSRARRPSPCRCRRR